MRALITGVAGFAGSYLAGDLAAAGWEVAGVERAGASLKNLEDIAGRVRVVECDILRHRELERIVREINPDVIFHLAAVTFVPSAENAPQIAFDVNVKGSLNVLEACRKEAPVARVVLVSSAEVYGRVSPEDMPLTEERKTAPANIYALTKLLSEQMAIFYERAYGFNIVILRPFNHIGPRQSPSFVTSAFAKQIAEIEAGNMEPVMEVGNLEAARDFTDVRDVVRAYRLAAERGVPAHVYNICSGRSCVIRKILDGLLELSGAVIEVRQDPKRLRKSEVPVRLGDYSRFKEATGWTPEYDIDSTLQDILDYWREQLKA